MKRFKLAFMAIAVVTSTLLCVSCDKNEDIVNPDLVKLSLNSITISLDIDKGSLPEEYVGELSKVIVRRYMGEGTFSDIATLVEKCVVAPMQEKIDEIAVASGCDDFSVTSRHTRLKTQRRLYIQRLLNLLNYETVSRLRGNNRISKEEFWQGDYSHHLK